MVMITGLFGNAIKNVFNGAIDYDTDQLDAQLTLDSYVSDHDSHEFESSVEGSIVAGTTNQTLGSKTVTVDTASDWVEFGCGNLTWSAVASGTVGGFIVFKERGGLSSANELLCENEFTANVTANGSDITATIHADGLFTISYQVS